MIHLSRFLLLAGMAWLATLMGCSGASNDVAAPADPTASVAQATNPAATPEPASAAKRDEFKSAPEPLKRLQCPATRADGPDDIAGLQIGMSFEEALQLLRCHTGDKGHFNWLTSALNIEGSQGLLTRQGIDLVVGRRVSACDDQNLKTGRPDLYQMRCLNGGHSDLDVTETFRVMTPGPDDQQKVIGVWRKQIFAPGKEPSAEAVLAALKKKYGEPLKDKYRPNPNPMQWVRDGGALSEHQALMCSFQVNATAAQGASFSDNCPLVISAYYRTTGTDGVLVSELDVGMADGRQGIAIADQTQAFVDARRQQKSADEVRNAADQDVKL